MAQIHTLRIQQKTWLADGIIGVTLVDPARQELPPWEPGAHIALHLPNGLVREYSLCSDPHDRHAWTVAVLRVPDSRGGSKHIHEQLQVGTLVEVHGPHNAFSLEQSASEHVLVAGGIGITPIISMVRSLAGSGANWRLLYLGRSRPLMAFLDEVAGLPEDRVLVHADDEAEGFPDVRAMIGDVAPDAVVYCCGPEPLLGVCADALADPKQLRVERFKAPEAQSKAGGESAFGVVVASTGVRVVVPPDVSVLDALAAAGVHVDSSCTEGICGTCEVGVIKGDIDHRDFVLNEQERASGRIMLTCVSRCRSAELVLEL